MFFLFTLIICTGINWGQKPKEVSALGLLQLFFILEETSCGGLAFSVLTVALYSEIYVIHNVPL